MAGGNVQRGKIAIPLVVLVAVACFWTVAILQADDAVFSRAPLLDELWYLDRASDIRAGDFPGDTPFFMTPLYPLLVAATGSGSHLDEVGVLPAGDLHALRVLQAAMWIAVLLLLRRIAGRTFGAGLEPGWRRELVVWTPALLFASYRPVAVATLGILLEMPLLLLLTLALDLMLTGPPTLRRGLVLGLVLGLAALLRGTALALLPLALVFAARSKEAGARGLRIAALVLAIALVLLPATVHNSRLAGRLTGPTLNAGLNLAIGNGTGANGFYRTLFDGDWRTDPAGTRYLADRMGRETLSIAEADSAWMKEARAEIAARPLPALGNYFRRIWLYLQGWEIDQLAPLDGWRQATPVLQLLALPWRWIVVLACGAIGVLIAAERHNRPVAAVWLVGAVISLVAVQSLFFVVTRYRLALVPALCLLAGAGVAQGVRPGVSRGRWLSLLFAVAGILITQPWGLDEVRADWRAQAAAQEAHRWALLAEYPSAIDRYEEALAARRTRPDWWLGLALSQLDLGRPELAEQTLRAGMVRHPGDLMLQKTLLNLLLAGGRTDEALDLTGTLLVDHPRDAEVLHNHIVLLAGAGRPAEALGFAQQLILRHPGKASGYLDLGVLQARGGRPDLARDTFRRGLERVPGDSDLLENLQQVGR